MSFARSALPTLRQAVRAAPTPAAHFARALSSTSSTPAAFDSALAKAVSPHPITPPPSSSSSSTSSFASTSTTPSPSSDPSPDTALLYTLSRLLMRSGKLARAHSHLATMLQTLQLQTQSPPMPLLHKALEVVSPSIRIVGRRKGTKSLPTPQPLTEAQRRRQAWLWIVEASEKRQGAEKVFGRRLAGEVMGVLQGQSEAIKKKESRHLQGVTGRANVGR